MFNASMIEMKMMTDTIFMAKLNQRGAAFLPNENQATSALLLSMQVLSDFV